jgi:hypothetical protein
VVSLRSITGELLKSLRDKDKYWTQQAIENRYPHCQAPDVLAIGSNSTSSAATQTFHRQFVHQAGLAILLESPRRP